MEQSKYLQNPLIFGVCSGLILVICVAIYVKSQKKKKENKENKTNFVELVKLFFASGILNSVLFYIAKGGKIFTEGKKILVEQANNAQSGGGDTNFVHLTGEFPSKQIYTDEPNW
jgi:hypothetical protein